jgi:death-on-curing protein
MSAGILYLNENQVVEIHRKTVEVSGGGALGVLRINDLFGVLEHLKNDDYYPSFSEKIAHLFFCACKFHGFQDGNKRIAITLCTQMLLLNGYLFCASSFISEMENISYHVAAGKIDKCLLNEIMDAAIHGELDEEQLKLKILDAISAA